MFLKSMRFYRLDAQPEARATDYSRALSAGLAAMPYVPLTALQASTIGWVPPFPGSIELVEVVAGRLVFAAKIAEKILPAAVVNDRLGDKVDQIEAERGTRPGRKERSVLRDDVIAELLPQAFVRTHVVRGWLDLHNRWLVVGSSSATEADNVTAHLRECLGSLPVRPLGTINTQPDLLTSWYNRGTPLPRDTALTEHVRCFMPGDPTVSAKYKNIGLEAAEIRHSLDSGMRIDQLGVAFENRFTAVVDKDLVLKQIKYDEALRMQTVDSDNPAADAWLTIGAATDWLHYFKGVVA